MSDERLKGRRILVVGGGSQAAGDPDAPPSNGRAISVLAAREGATVAVADRVEAAAIETLAHAREAGGAATAIVADVARPADCERIVVEAAEAMDGIDGIVLNVGIGIAGLGLEGTDVEAWDKVLAVNLRSHFLITRRAIGMLPEGASIVFISSLAGVRAGSFLPAYDSSKAGLIGLVPARRAGGCAARRPRQRGRSRVDRHPARPHGLQGAIQPRADADPARPAGHGVGGRPRGRLPALRRCQLHHRRDADGRRRPGAYLATCRLCGAWPLANARSGPSRCRRRHVPHRAQATACGA